MSYFLIKAVSNNNWAILINEIIIKIYPNPLIVTESNLQIEFSGNKAYARLTDLMGRVVSQFYIINGVNQIKLPIEVKGLYILKIIDNNEKQFTHKIIAN